MVFGLYISPSLSKEELERGKGTVEMFQDWGLIWEYIV